MFEQIIASYKSFLYPFAELVACTLEFIGVLIIIVGSVRALIRLIQCLVRKAPFHVGVD